MEAKVPLPPIIPDLSEEDRKLVVEIVSMLTHKMKMMQSGPHYGEIGVKIVFMKGKRHRIVWNDEISNLFTTSSDKIPGSVLNR